MQGRNKRLALILTAAFLDANGYEIDPTADETEHVYRHLAGSESADYEMVMALLTHSFEETIRPMVEEEERWN